jgi:hypothetical protein
VNSMRALLLFAAALLVAAPPAYAQHDEPRGSASGMVGVGKTWDDEGGLGRGPSGGGRVSWRLFGNTAVEGALDALSHDRDTGLFQAEGHSTALSLSLVHRFGHGRAQPYVLEGLSLVRHSGSSRFDDLEFVRKSTDPAFHFGVGLAIKVGERLEIGPEGRFYVIRAGHGSDPAWANWVGIRVGFGF